MLSVTNISIGNVSVRVEVPYTPSTTNYELLHSYRQKAIEELRTALSNVEYSNVEVTSTGGIIWVDAQHELLASIGD